MADDAYEFGGEGDSPASAPFPDPTVPTARVSTLDVEDPEVSLLARLRSKIENEVKREDITLSVPERPSIQIRYSPNITDSQLKKWRQAAGERTRAGVDSMKFGTQVLAHCCTGILLDGEIVTEDGYPVTFASDVVQEMVGASRPWPDAVRKMYGIDPHVDAAALAVMEAAGYGDDVSEGDPQQTS